MRTWTGYEPRQRIPHGRSLREHGYGVNGTVSDPKDLDSLRTAIRFYKVAESAQASDTTSCFMGATKVPCH